MQNLELRKAQRSVGNMVLELFWATIAATFVLGAIFGAPL